MNLRLILVAAIFVVGLAKVQAGPLEGVVHLTFPLTKKKMLGIFLDARLYEYDPLLADFPATLVDQVEIRDLDLSTTGDSLLDVHFSATRKLRMNYYLSIRAYSRKGGMQYYFIDGFQKIFTGKDEDEIDLRLATRLTRKKPEGDAVQVGSGGSGEPVGKVTGIYRAVEIEWEGTDGDEFLLQKSDDLENWETVETVVGTGDATSTFLRVEGRVQFWRLHRE